MSTCQICGREIKANTGVIAHHGYRRPGCGWQTASCMGAKHFAYELSCDRIAAAIQSVQTFVDNASTNLDILNGNPPKTITFSFNRKSYTVDKPDNFNPDTAFGCLRPRTYENEYAKLVSEGQRSIKSAKVDLNFLKERLAKWIAPQPGR